VSTNLFPKSLIAGAALAALVVMGVVVRPPSARAKNDNNGSQDEKEMIQIGLAVAPVPLNMAGKDPDMVGLGSYIVNVTGDCNGCHSHGPATEYVVPSGNPYLLQPPYSGTTQVNAATYLGGGRDFGAFPPLPGALLHIISRNLTPDKSGLPEGGRTLAEFIEIMRTGVDLDHAHPNCTGNVPGPNCMLAPFDGDKLQIMRWPSFRSMTDRQLTAIYTYLSTVPCLEGGPGEPSPRCQ
jgi:hypothetical protein